ncbi:MAG: tetratricopeptide repeat protein [Bdellovibrio sp.]|nr:tetratricopeptide repeat protein [Bdellovibrio sp.]
MNKIIFILSALFVLGCASSPKSTGDGEDSGGLSVTDAPGLEGSESSSASRAKEAPEVQAEPEKKPVVIASSQYSALNATIKNQNDEAIYKAATDILAQSSADPRASNALAMYHYKRGRFDLSRYLLNKAIAASPRTAELYSNLGVVQLAQNERRDAVKSFRKALEINSQEPVAAANLGAIYVQERDYNKAVMVLDIAQKKGIRDTRVLSNYGIALTATGKYDKAKDMYKAALKENDSNREAMLNYAILLIDKMEKYQDGLEVLNRLKFVGGPADSRNRIIALENKAKAGIK